MFESEHQEIWIDDSEKLPDTCVTCGMFTDQMAKVKAVQHHQKMVPASESNSMMALGCLLHLLGPIGLIVDAALRQGSTNPATVQKTVVSKSKVKVPCCRLCVSHGTPEPTSSDVITGRYAFNAHPRFIERLNIMRREAMDDA